MRTFAARLLCEAPSPGAFPPSGLNEIAVVGRSNAGKSTLINTLVGQRSLARVSRQPGRTRSLFFFEIERRFLLVDLPGYGFAKASKGDQVRWQALVEAYFQVERPIRAAVALFDLRREPDALDHALLLMLARRGLSTLTVFTKADKLSRSEQDRAHSARVRALGVTRSLLFSSHTRQGRDELIAWVEDRAG